MDREKFVPCENFPLCGVPCNSEVSQVPTVKDSSFFLLQGANILLTDSGAVKLGECAYCNAPMYIAFVSFLRALCKQREP